MKKLLAIALLAASFTASAKDLDHDRSVLTMGIYLGCVFRSANLAPIMWPIHSLPGLKLQTVAEIIDEQCHSVVVKAWPDDITGGPNYQNWLRVYPDERRIWREEEGPKLLRKSYLPD